MKINRYYFKYELKSLVFNGYSLLFGLALPIVLLYLVNFTIEKNVPAAYREEVLTSLALGMSTLIALAGIFITHSASYAKEVEENIPLRLVLFGKSPVEMFISKMVSYLIFVIAGNLIYGVCAMHFVNVPMGDWKAVLIFVIAQLYWSVLLLCLAHGIASIVKKYSVSFALAMIIYFAFMILAGYMGISLTDLPKSIQNISELNPMTYFGNGFEKYWLGHTYDFHKMIMSYVYMSVISFIVLIIGLKRSRKKI